MDRRILLRWVLVIVAVAGLAVDAYVHLDLAAQYDPIKESGTLSQGDLFRVEAVAAIVAGVALLVFARWYTALFAALVLGGGAGAVLLYRYHDVGKVLFLPNMYEPIWFTEKTNSFWAEVVGLLAALAVLALSVRGRSRATPASR